MIWLSCICYGDKPVNQSSLYHRNVLDIMENTRAQAREITGVICGIQDCAVIGVIGFFCLKDKVGYWWVLGEYPKEHLSLEYSAEHLLCG